MTEYFCLFCGHDFNNLSGEGACPACGRSAILNRKRSPLRKLLFWLSPWRPGTEPPNHKEVVLVIAKENVLCFGWYKAEEGWCFDNPLAEECARWREIGLPDAFSLTKKLKG